MSRRSGGSMSGGGFLIGIMFFMVLVMVMQLSSASYVPTKGDIVPCDQILTISGKQAVLDNWGMVDFYVTFDNGQRISLYGSEDYDRLPAPGTKILPRYVSQRMRTGPTLESFHVIDAVQSSTVQNACVITSGKSQDETTCKKPESVSEPAWVNAGNIPYGTEIVCWWYGGSS
jgi:hypothetical protein